MKDLVTSSGEDAELQLPPCAKHIMANEKLPKHGMALSIYRQCLVYPFWAAVETSMEEDSLHM